MVITRRDLKAGYQAVQAAHALINFQYEHPDIAYDWYVNFQYLVSLSVKDEDELNLFIEKFKEANLKFTVFREPDIGNQITAIAVQPSERTLKLVSRLPLMLKHVNNGQEKNLCMEGQVPSEEKIKGTLERKCA